MASRFDILLNDNDVVVTNNDVVLVESDDQHIADTINACPGWWKENPTDGVGVLRYLKGKNIQQELAKNIKLQLKADNYNSSPKVTYDNTQTLNIDTNVSL